MNSPISQVLWTAAVLAAFCTAAARAVESGQLAPDFTFTDLAGTTQKLSDFRGKVVVLEWLNPGCTVVFRHYRSGSMPSTQTMAAADGAVWLQINSSAMGDLEAAKSVEWQNKHGAIATAYIRDPTGKLGRLYGAVVTPHLFVISKDGRLVYQGAIDDQPNASQAATMSAHNYVKAALTALKNSKPVEPATTAAYGCGLKYGPEP